MVGDSVRTPGVTREILPVSRRVDGSVIGVPLITVTGKEPGPTLLVVGGTHGDEQEGIASVLGVVERLDPEQMRGTFMGVTMLNLPAYDSRQRGNPMDDWWYDMNRLFPGAANGSITQRLANKCATDLVPKADLIVLIHSGGSNLYNPARIIMHSTAPEHMELARAMGPKWDLIARGTGERANISDLGAYCTSKGKPVLTLELGGISARLPEPFEADIDCFVDGLLNVMKHYKMTPGRAKYAKEIVVVVYEPVRVTNSGFTRMAPGCRPRGFVRGGELLFTVLDVLGNPLEEVRAPYDCILVAVPGQVSVPGGTQVASAGRVVERLTHKED
jgi:hypothetical protein